MVKIDIGNGTKGIDNKLDFPFADETSLRKVVSRDAILAHHLLKNRSLSACYEVQWTWQKTEDKTGQAKDIMGDQWGTLEYNSTLIVRRLIGVPTIKIYIKSGDQIAETFTLTSDTAVPYAVILGNKGLNGTEDITVQYSFAKNKGDGRWRKGFEIDYKELKEVLQEQWDNSLKKKLSNAKGDIRTQRRRSRGQKASELYSIARERTVGSDFGPFWCPA